jgi:hypothetical protein
MTEQPSLFSEQINTTTLRKPKQGDYKFWIKKLTGRDLDRDYTPISRTLGVSPIDPIADLAARAFVEHGRCPECGWFAGHCSHTAVLGADGRYHS